EPPREVGSPGRRQSGKRHLVAPVFVLGAAKQPVLPAHEGTPQPHAAAHVAPGQVLAFAVDAARDGPHQLSAAGVGVITLAFAPATPFSYNNHAPPAPMMTPTVFAATSSVSRILLRAMTPLAATAAARTAQSPVALST